MIQVSLGVLLHASIYIWNPIFVLLLTYCSVTHLHISVSYCLIAYLLFRCVYLFRLPYYPYSLVFQREGRVAVTATGKARTQLDHYWTTSGKANHQFRSEAHPPYLFQWSVTLLVGNYTYCPAYLVESHKPNLLLNRMPTMRCVKHLSPVVLAWSFSVVPALHSLLPAFFPESQEQRWVPVFSLRKGQERVQSILVQAIGSRASPGHRVKSESSPY